MSNGVANGHSKTEHATVPKTDGKAIPEKKPYKIQIVWRNIGLMTLLHSLALYGLYHYLFTAKWQTMLFTNFTTVLFGTISSAFVGDILPSHACHLFPQVWE